LALKPVKAKPLGPWGVYDLEWNPDKPWGVLLCGVRDESGYRAYRTVGEFLEGELTPENAGRWLFGHAGGLYDINFLVSWVLSHTDWAVEAAYSGSSAVALTIHRDGCEYHFGDSYWLLKAKLDDLGRMMGMVKGNDGNTARFVRECMAMGIPGAGWHRLKEYNAHDNEILYCALHELERVLVELGGALKITLASCALTLFRAAYLKREIRVAPSTNKKARLAYAASIVNPFAIECEDANYYDIISSFPASMTEPCPGELTRTSGRWTGSDLALVEATITVPEGYLPCIPYRHEERIFLPTGTWRGHFSGVDLVEGQKRGVRIERVHMAREFAPWLDLKAYVEDVYERRKKATSPIMKYAFKILMNALYGKLAENPMKYRTLIRPKKIPKGAQYVRLDVYRVMEKKPVPHEHVAAAMTITARSRYRLLDVDQAALDQGGRLFYNDTDSVITTADLSDLCGTELGQLKHEAVIKGGIFLAPKLYAIQEVGKDKREVRAKGFSRCTWDQFLLLAMGEAVPVEVFTRLRSMLASGHDEIAPEVIERSKRFVGAMRPKRCMLGTSDSRPWTVDEVKEPWKKEIESEQLCSEIARTVESLRA
jgi:hypothetical protein